MLLKRLFLPFCLGFSLVGLCHNASAQLLYHVAVDTSNLNPAFTYYVEFTLGDGSVVSTGFPDTNNSVDISAFTLGTGAPGLILSPIGDASGDISSTVHLADGDPAGVADFTQAFTPGNALNFDVAMTTQVDPGSPSDIFTLKLLDASQNTIATNAPADTADAFLRVDLVSPTLGLNSVQTFGNTSVPVAPPVITAQSSGPPATPEPGTMALLISSGACGSLALLRGRRARRAARIARG